MTNFQIIDHENNKTIDVQAQGFLEAIAEHLPLPTVEVEISWNPASGSASITDKTTNFKYTVNHI
ncbi:hypothetical protein [Vibrio sp. D431a]|uniref:hypothetical protein n=1 Tax=Vibrio sp. D431a TaxID=2837388 RepID=UPI002554E982|nr:hypothetical protein [Vibrio sp. D431a]MDK9793783.1 hypothetical protein [Vibrio sp. D431a]